MSPRSDGIICYNCDGETDRFYWRCADCGMIFCSTYCIQEMLQEHKRDCHGEIKHMRKNTSKPGIPCKFFFMGKCKNGSSCEFVHEKEQIPCEYFVNGDCKFGDNCVFLHDPYAQKLKKEVKPTPRVEAKKKEVKEVPVCTFFQRGMCTFGDKCFKQHVIVKSVKTFNTVNNNAINKTRIINNTNNNKSRPISPQKKTMQQQPVSSPVKVNSTNNVNYSNNEPNPSYDYLNKKANMNNPNNKAYYKANVAPANNRAAVNPANNRANVNGANETSASQYVPYNTADYELAVDDEIFLSDSSDEEDLYPEEAYAPSAAVLRAIPTRSSIPARGAAAAPVRIAAQIPPRFCQSSNANNQGKEDLKKAKECKKNLNKPKKTETVSGKKTEKQNIFLLLQESDESSSECEDAGQEYSDRPSSSGDRPSSSSDRPSSSVSAHSKPSTPIPKNLTKKEKKKLEKEQKIEDVKIIVNNLRLEGNRIFEEGNTDKAIELYTKAIAKAGANNPCHKLFNNRSAAYMMKKEYRQAHKDANKCLELDSDNNKATRRMVECCVQLGLIEEGREKLKHLFDLNKNASKDEKGANPKVLEKQLKDAERLLKEAEKFFTKGSYTVAEDYVDKLLNICKKGSRFLMMKATCAFLNDRKNDAEKILNRTDRKDPNVKCSWYYFIDGLVYYSKGDLNRARSQLSMAKKEIPKAEQWLEEVSQLDTYLVKARRLENDGDYEDALDALRAGLQLAKAGKGGKINVINVQIERIKVFKSMGEYNLAMDEVNSALENDSSQPKLHMEKARLYITGFCYNDYPSAIQSLDEAKRLSVLSHNVDLTREIDDLIKQFKREKEQEVNRKKWEEKESMRRKRREEAEAADRERNRRRREELEKEERQRREKYERERERIRAERKEEFMKTSFYATLEVSEDADQKEIQKAFHTKARMFHPDKHAAATDKEKKEMEEKMKDINNANKVLSDPEKRRAYDRKMEAFDDSDSDWEDDDSDDDDCFDVHTFFYRFFFAQTASRFGFAFH